MDFAMQAQLGPKQEPISAHGHSHWNPYANTNGTSLAIAGEDFVLVASDTRQSDGYSINTRYDSKAFELSNSSVLAISICSADGKRLHEVLEQRAQVYYHKHDKHIGTQALAQLLSNTLYGRRMFPYYVFPILAGIGPDGRGVAYSYDALGNMKDVTHIAYGSASALVQPFLDNQVGHLNQRGADLDARLDREQARKVAIDAFTGATERDIYTGDWLEIYIVDANGVHKEVRELKHD
ncbi:Proteasome subunit beta type-6 [Coemansia sp. RSA 1822]|nr:Proteasome subunit beta type-6 [Coemansia sp. RSA 638]KAJ2539203.1 Proteasome subunit beta type-6 [Coemansia sp. RSA 1853]KAJ2558812.1 Proteasome subunit beta type-6 [Coemansia sp. RSA 1822]